MVTGMPFIKQTTAELIRPSFTTTTVSDSYLDAMRKLARTKIAAHQFDQREQKIIGNHLGRNTKAGQDAFTRADEAEKEADEWMINKHLSAVESALRKGNAGPVPSARGLHKVKSAEVLNPAISLKTDEELRKRASGARKRQELLANSHPDKSKAWGNNARWYEKELEDRNKKEEKSVYLDGLMKDLKQRELGVIPPEHSHLRRVQSGEKLFNNLSELGGLSSTSSEELSNISKGAEWRAKLWNSESLGTVDPEKAALYMQKSLGANKLSHTTYIAAEIKKIEERSLSAR